jgi:type I restriction enzyme S subunit
VALFLDAETAKIDELIEEQRLLIELLKEKRQAVISHAVTKGLNPDGQMKSSGVDWIGDVPVHWHLGKFTREVRVAEGQVDPRVEPFSSMLLIGPEHVEARTGRLLRRQSASEQAAESGKYFCKRSDVIYSKIRPALGKVALAPEDCLCSADMYPLTSRGKLQHNFLYWLLLSDQFIAWSVLESDRVAMPKLNRETLSKLMIPLPPPTDQDAISRYLQSVVDKYDELYGEASNAVMFLQERRAALISTAVTGKIDVRNFTPKEVV